jgi:hypothetical protein
MTNNPIDALDATKFIQRIIEERDEALARNRELEAENERAVRDQLAMATHMQALEEEKAGMESIFSDTREENAKLQEQISILATHNQALELDLDTCKLENQTLKSLVRDWQQLMQDWDDLPVSAPTSVYEEWGAEWKKLVLCTDLLLKGEAHVE